MLIIKKISNYIQSKYKLTQVILIISIIIIITSIILFFGYTFIDAKLFKNTGWEIVSFITLLTWFLFSTITLTISLNLQKEVVRDWVVNKNIKDMKETRMNIVSNIIFQLLLSIIICIWSILLKNVENGFCSFIYWFIISVFLLEILLIIFLLNDFVDYVTDYFIFWKEQ